MAHRGRGEPVLSGHGSLIPDSPGSVELDDAQAPSAAILLFGLTSGAVPVKGGNDGVLPDRRALNLSTSPTGEIDLPWRAWPAGVPSRTPLYFQIWIADPAGPQGAAASNGLLALQP